MVYEWLRGPQRPEELAAHAACAIGWDARLWTLNVADFEDIAGLELYRPGLS